MKFDDEPPARPPPPAPIRTNSFNYTQQKPNQFSYCSGKRSMIIEFCYLYLDLAIMSDLSNSNELGNFTTFRKVVKILQTSPIKVNSIDSIGFSK